MKTKITTASIIAVSLSSCTLPVSALTACGMAAIGESAEVLLVDKLIKTNQPITKVTKPKGLGFYSKLVEDKEI